MSLIKVSVKRIAQTAPYESIHIDIGVEQEALPDEKLLPQIARLGAGLRLEADRAIETWQREIA